MQTLIQILKVLVVIIFIIVSFIQFTAISAGLKEWIGLPWIIVTPVSFILASLPIIGTIIGVIGAIKIWHWSLIQAIALFIWPLLIVLIYLLIFLIKEKVLYKKSSIDNLG